MEHPKAGEGTSTEATRDPEQAPDAGALGADRLAALCRIARALLAERDPGAVIERILRAAVEALSAERACVLALAADGTPRALGEHGLELGAAAEDWPISLSVVRHVAQTGLAVLASDIRGDAAFKGSASVHRFRIRSLLAVPLGPRPSRGVLYLDTLAAERSFSAADLDFATALGAQAALVLDRALEHAGTLEALARSDERLELLQAELLRHEIIGRSPALLSAYDALRRFARGGARVLLRGETGTGKELFARAYALESGRGARGWVPVPIPALSPTLVESELFGHVRGAFTEATRDKKGRLELADGGVLFLDEIGDVEPALQTKLLRFLDSGELVRVGDTAARRVDALVVCATNRPLEQDVVAGRFRPDLLARLGQTVVLPPLRDRPEDVPLLVEHARARLERGRAGHRFAPETLALLSRYAWPFNVRELQLVVERVVCLVDADVIEPRHLPEELRRAASGATPRSASWAPGPLREVVDAAEREHVSRVLEHTGGNKRRAIEILGIAPETFYRRLETWGLHRRDEDQG